MANIQFKALGKNDPVNLNVRFYHSKINCYAKSNIFVELKDWSNKTFKIKHTAPDDVKKYIGEKTEGLSKQILNAFKVDFPKGSLIDSDWLVRQVNLFHGKPNNYDDYRYYFVAFLRKYIEESKTRVNPKTNKQISPKTIQNYTTTLTQIESFEKQINHRFRIKEIDLKFHNKFTSYLSIECEYSGTLIEKYISQIRGFVKEAKIEGYETSLEVESTKFTFKRDESIDTYLDETEIDLLFDLDLSKNKMYDKVRDLFIVGVWTGLRVSDLKRLNTFRVTDSRIQILATEKNKASVEIPIHSQLRHVISKYNGKFPEISDQKFNLYIKEICRIAGIDKVTLGRVKDPEKNRKKLDYYPKYKMISSHTCRRSFVTNHYGKLDDITIMAITTHKSHSQFVKYVKTTSEEFASKIETYWREREETKQSELKLKVVV